MLKSSLLILSVIAAGAGGCNPAAKIRLIQPNLKGAQRDLLLTSDQVYWAAEEKSSTQRLLAEFPLPGAATGRSTYILYLRMTPAPPPDKKADNRPDTTQGFFIQSRGEFAGLAAISGGRASVKGASRSKTASRKVELDLTCEDGSKITGRLTARRDEYQLKIFETQRRPADVRRVIETAPAVSAPRP